MKVVFDNLRSAYNVGSMIRTCDAFGIKDIYFSGITPDLKNSKVLKTSLGAEKNIRAHEAQNTKELLQSFDKSRYELVGLEIAEGSVDINDFKLKKEVILVIGNEISGLSSEIIKECKVILKIPMSGIKESLNVSVAFGIATYLLTRQELETLT
jgi:23S rRNA (guanosine2251-2'-O)-methyltransferase